jgi:glucosyl-3-phosphoglycerate synthase
MSRTPLSLSPLSRNPLARDAAGGSLADLIDAKQGRAVSICIPARNEDRTVGRLVANLRGSLMKATGLVDEIIVLDHDSTDRTAEMARQAGAQVIAAGQVLTDFGPPVGKGDVLWRSLAVAQGDVVLWCDADLRGLSPLAFAELLRPLFTDPGVVLAKSSGARLLKGRPGEGGRVTELLARPVLEVLFPEVAHLRQPLGGEYGGHRAELLTLPFEADYGVEIGLLIDVAERFGVGSIAEVPTGTRAHRNRPLDELAVQARQVLRAVISRAGLPTSGLPSAPLRPPMIASVALQGAGYGS